ncbi:EAL domain-containing protein [Herbaspirillum sp.]|uniref:EAL domain-containing protein n=1 Tax=Herbaspirillum sp. TaxID=1890675 RepID=UPI0031D232DB
MWNNSEKNVGDILQQTMTGVSGQGFREDVLLANRLLADLRLNKLAVAFQPVATDGSADAGSSMYHECLLRRLGPEAAHGDYSVPDAIQALERLDLVDRLDRSMLWTTLGALADSEALSLGCNVSARSFVITGWWSELMAHLEDRPDLAQRLVIEITETSTFPKEESALALIQHLQLLGVRIALDDIGKEPGSLAILDKVHADIVKFDKSVLEESADGELPLQLLRDMASACKDRGASVVMEGIDTAAKLEAALSAGAAGVQGYLIARPSLHLQGLSDHVLRVKSNMRTKASLIQDTYAKNAGKHAASDWKVRLYA